MTAEVIYTQWLRTLGGFEAFRELFRLTALVRGYDLEAVFDDVSKCYLAPYLQGVPEVAEDSDEWIHVVWAANRLAYAVLLRRRAVVTKYTVSEATKENAAPLSSRTLAEIRTYRTAAVGYLKTALEGLGVQYFPCRFIPLLDDEI